MCQDFFKLTIVIATTGSYTFIPVWMSLMTDQSYRSRRNQIFVDLINPIPVLFHRYQREIRSLQTNKHANSLLISTCILTFINWSLSNVVCENSLLTLAVLNQFEWSSKEHIMAGTTVLIISGSSQFIRIKFSMVYGYIGLINIVPFHRVWFEIRGENLLLWFWNKNA